MSIFRRPPLPLTAPDGRVFAWACPHCLAIGGAWPSPGGPDAEERREDFAAASLADVEACGVCRGCDTFIVNHHPYDSECAECVAKRAPRPNGRHATCPGCHGETEVEALVAGVVVAVQCPTCKGDGSVWEAA